VVEGGPYGGRIYTAGGSPEVNPTYNGMVANLTFESSYCGVKIKEQILSKLYSLRSVYFLFCFTKSYPNFCLIRLLKNITIYANKLKICGNRPVLQILSPPTEYLHLLCAACSTDLTIMEEGCLQRKIQVPPCCPPFFILVTKS
jgi:hypothetical protein